jgi:membrane protease YdiL (CAAX protease family)
MSQSIVIFLLFAVVQVVSSLAALLFSNLDKLGSGLPLEGLNTQPSTMGLCLLIGETIIGTGLWYYYHTETIYHRLIRANISQDASTEAANSADPSLKGAYLFPTIKRHLPEHPISWKRDTIYVLVTIGVALLIGEILPYLGIDDSAEESLFKGMLSNPLCLVLLCIIGPWAEELTFRKGIVRGLYRYGLPGWASALIAALAFALIHGNLAQGIPALIIGFLLGWLYLRTGNLKLCLTAHIINNVIAALLMI